MIPHPVVWNNARIKVAHDPLPYVVDAMLIMPLVHLRDSSFVGGHGGEVLDVVVLPDVVQTMDLVRAHRNSEVPATCSGRILDS